MRILGLGWGGAPPKSAHTWTAACDTILLLTWRLADMGLEEATELIGFGVCVSNTSKGQDKLIKKVAPRFLWGKCPGAYSQRGWPVSHPIRG